MKGAQIGFALDILTPIPTPDGFKTIGDLRIGDVVFDENGEPTKIIKSTGIMRGHRCYDVEFTDGSIIRCDADHLWTVKDLKNVTRTLSTEYISKRFKKIKKSGRNRNRYSVTNTKPIQLPHKDLPIDPYLLGLWLGDGNTNQNRITASIHDAEFYSDQMSKRGIKTEIIPYPKQTNTCYLKIIDHFNVWKGGSNLYGNKHIPIEYLTASESQRLEVVQGLIDTDGHIMKDGKVEFYNTNKQLIDSARHLIESLGYKVTIRVRDNEDIYTTIHPTRRYKMKPLYILNFMGTSDIPVAKLPRKADRLRAFARYTERYN